MAKDGPGGEKTEKPTPQRLKKARKEGQIPRTPELGTWIGVAVASVMLPMLVGKSFTTVQQLFVKVVGAYAKTHFDFSFSNQVYDNDMFSVRVRLMYLY